MDVRAGLYVAGIWHHRPERIYRLRAGDLDQHRLYACRGQPVVQGADRTAADDAGSVHDPRASLECLLETAPAQPGHRIALDDFIERMQRRLRHMVAGCQTVGCVRQQHGLHRVNRTSREPNRLAPRPGLGAYPVDSPGIAKMDAGVVVGQFLRRNAGHSAATHLYMASAHPLDGDGFGVEVLDRFHQGGSLGSRVSQALAIGYLRLQGAGRSEEPTSELQSLKPTT